MGALVTRVLDATSHARTIGDLYSGVGLFAVALAARGSRVVAVEGDESSGGDLDDRTPSRGARLRVSWHSSVEKILADAAGPRRPRRGGRRSAAHGHVTRGREGPRALAAAAPRLRIVRSADAGARDAARAHHARRDSRRLRSLPEHSPRGNDCGLRRGVLGAQLAPSRCATFPVRWHAARAEPRKSRREFRTERRVFQRGDTDRGATVGTPAASARNRTARSARFDARMEVRFPRSHDIRRKDSRARCASRGSDVPH